MSPDLFIASNKHEVFGLGTRWVLEFYLDYKSLTKDFVLYLKFQSCNISTKVSKFLPKNRYLEN